MFWSQHLGCSGQNTSRIQNKGVYATLCLQAWTVRAVTHVDTSTPPLAHTMPTCFAICDPLMEYSRFRTGCSMQMPCTVANVLRTTHQNENSETKLNQFSFIRFDHCSFIHHCATYDKLKRVYKTDAANQRRGGICFSYGLPANHMAAKSTCCAMHVVQPGTRQLWLNAYGIDAVLDPYYEHHCRVDFGAGGASLVVLTASNLVNRIAPPNHPPSADHALS